MARHSLFAGALVLVAWGAQGFAQAPPKAEVDPLWPKPLPNHWILGSITGVAVDILNTLKCPNFVVSSSPTTGVK